MRASARIALILPVLLALAVTGSPLSAADLVSDHIWRERFEGFGGFSALHVSEGGESFVALSDKGRMVTGRLRRDAGRITGVEDISYDWLRDPRGQPLEDWLTDAEGIAIDPDGRVFVSFEGQHRIWRYNGLGSKALALRNPREFAVLQKNSGLEALAIDERRRLLAVPERSGRLERPFPVYRYDRGRWTVPFALPRRPPYLPVALDVGPEGRLYLLERHLEGIFFTSRLRRFTLEDDRIVKEEALLETPTARHQNLEGLSIWRNPDGDLMATMISDDGFRPFWNTAFVEYRLRD